MKRQKVRRLPVVDNGQIVGMFRWAISPGKKYDMEISSALDRNIKAAGTGRKRESSARRN